jgi:small subunit ribosomal protein S16
MNPPWFCSRTPATRGLTRKWAPGALNGFSERLVHPYVSIMALKIRLSRIGTKHKPVYRGVVTEERYRRDGAATEILGTYTPEAKGNTLQIDLARVDYWHSKGARPTDTMRALIKKERRRQAAVAAAAPVAAPAAAAPATIAPAPAAAEPAVATAAPAAPAAATPAPAI